MCSCPCEPASFVCVRELWLFLWSCVPTVDTAVANSFILFNKLTDQDIHNLAGYRARLVDELLHASGVHIPPHPRDVAGARGPTDVVDVDGSLVEVRVSFGQHELYIEPDKDKRADCCICKKKTNIKCLTCLRWYCLVSDRNHWAVAHQPSALRASV